MKSCKEIAKLLVPGKKLFFQEKIEIKMHLLMCELCRKYEKQLKLISFKKIKNIPIEDNISDKEVCELEQEIINEITKTGP